MKRPQHHAHHRHNRRTFLKRTAATSLGALLGGRMAHGTTQAQELAATRHGTLPRGIFLPGKDRLTEGRFGIMFKRLPAFAPPDHLLTELGQSMMEEQPPGTPDDAHLSTSPRLFAGFTFLGQFLDHDITFDNTPLAQRQDDPDALKNFRTPRYDLDSMYGKGPTDEPWLYDPNDRDKLLLTNIGGVEDVPRWTQEEKDAGLLPPGKTVGMAKIPEGRNDENLIIIQLHIAFMKFHNRLVDHVRSQGMRREWVFEAAQRLARWHYQWMIIHDFLPRFVGDALVGPNGQVYKEVAGKPQ